MKRLLYGTTAIVAASLLAGGAAVAAEKIKMGVGGYGQFFFFAGDDDKKDLREHSVAREMEIIFNGVTTFDNGLKVGAQVQLEAEVCGDQIDESFLYFSGSWGRLQLGSENSAPYAMAYGSPAPSHWAHGMNSPNFNHISGGTGHGIGVIGTTNNALTSDQEKITYFTPRFSGFQFGVSYTPDNCEETNSSDDRDCNGSYGGFRNDSGATKTKTGDTVEIGINYVGNFDDVGINLSAGYSEADDEVGSSVTDDPVQYRVGGNASFAGFTVGAAWQHSDNVGAVNNKDRDDVNIGARYASGPWGVGIQYGWADVDMASGEDDFEGVEVGGSYTLGPGVLLSAAVQWYDYDSDATKASENDGWIVFVGTHVAF